MGSMHFDGRVPAVCGRVAQLVRALVSHTRGPGFESLRDHLPCGRREA
jgi:hypothetical protein